MITRCISGSSIRKNSSDSIPKGSERAERFLRHELRHNEPNKSLVITKADINPDVQSPEATQPPHNALGL